MDNIIWIILLILYFAVFIVPAVFMVIGAVKKHRSMLIISAVAESVLLLFSVVLFMMLGISGLAFLFVVVFTLCAVPVITVIGLTILGIIYKKLRLSIICGVITALMALAFIVFYI